MGQEAHVGYERLVNEDEFGHFSTAVGELFVIAGGQKGQAGAKVASEVALKAFTDYLNENQGSPEFLLRDALLAAEMAVEDSMAKFPELGGLGPSLVALLLDGGEAWYLQVGASRLYLATAQGLVSLAGSALTVGQSHDSINAPLGSGLTPAQLKINSHLCSPDDTFLLATAGLPALVRESEIYAVLAGAADPQVKARSLIEAALKNGGADNITAQVVTWHPSGKTLAKNVNKFSNLWQKHGLAFIIGFFTGLLAFWLWGRVW